MNEDYDPINWRKDLKEYTKSKTRLPWKVNPHVTYITDKMKKEIEGKYNPILQTYTDSTYEKHLREQELYNMIETLARNKV